MKSDFMPAARRTALVISFCAVLAVSVLAASTQGRADGVPPTDSVTLKVITYNVCGLADFITFDRNLANTTKRFELIGSRLRAYDIIGLQEAFVGKREIIAKGLWDYYLARGTDTYGYGKIGSGIYNFSRWPILSSMYQKWNVSAGPDALSHKGFVAMRTQIAQDFEVDVYNLHAQAGGGGPDMRKKNYDQLAKAMDYYSRSSEPRRPIILIGDFNCDFWDDDCKHLVKVTKTTSVVPEQSSVDHIFYDENDSGWKISVQETKASFTDKMGGKHISDHEAFEAVLRLDRKK